MAFKQSIKATLERLHLLDRSIFLWEDQLRGFSLSRSLRNLRYRLWGAPDGLPIPPPYLIWLVVGTSDIEAFLDAGRIHAEELIRSTVERNGLALDRFDAMLDFGCGCGRILRYWKDLRHVDLCGSDYNPLLVRWCRRHLSFARFEVNELSPPLRFTAGTFDFVYARSVFTHLDEELQLAWIEELGRVLRVGGHLLLTVSGDAMLGRMTPPEARQYAAGRLVVRAGELEGKNYCAAYHPRQYVEDVLAGDRFEVVDFIPGDVARPYCAQDAYLLRRR